MNFEQQLARPPLSGIGYQDSNNRGNTFIVSGEDLMGKLIRVRQLRTSPEWRIHSGSKGQVTLIETRTGAGYSTDRDIIRGRIQGRILEVVDED